MKPYEIIKDIFIVGGPDITDGRDGCIYLMNLGELILIDTGAGWSVEKIINNIKKLGFDRKNLSKILLTHCHIDHIGGVPEIKKRFGSKIYIHKLDAPPLENGDPILTAAKWYQTTFPPTPVDVKFNFPEEILMIGEQKIICLHTPGHTPDQYASIWIKMESEFFLVKTFMVLCLPSLVRISKITVGQPRNYSTSMQISSAKATLEFIRQRKM